MKNKILNTHTIHKKKKKNIIVPFIYNEKPKLLKKILKIPSFFHSPTTRKRSRTIKNSPDVESSSASSMFIALDILESLLNIRAGRRAGEGGGAIIVCPRSLPPSFPFALVSRGGIISLA